MLSRQEWQKWGGATVTLGTVSLQPITHEKYWLILRGRVGSVGPAPSDPEGLAKIESGQWQQQGGWPNNRYLTFAPVPFGIAWQLYDVCPGFLFGCQGISWVCQCESLRWHKRLESGWRSLVLVFYLVLSLRQDPLCYGDNYPFFGRLSSSRVRSRLCGVVGVVLLDKLFILW